MNVTIRAFDANGYHKDIFHATEKQVWSRDSRVTEPRDSCFSGLIGFGGSVDPKDFPEMVRFEIVISKD